MPRSFRSTHSFLKTATCLAVVAALSFSQSAIAHAHEVEQPDNSRPIGTIERPAFFVPDADEAARFFIEILGYEHVATWTREASIAENDLRLPIGALGKTIGLKAPDGLSTVAIIGVTSDEMPTLAYPDGFTPAFGQVMMLYKCPPSAPMAQI